MQEHATKEQSRSRRTSPIHIVDNGRMAQSSADALRDVHMSLVRAEQNLYNLVQANHAANGSLGHGLGTAGFGYGTPQVFAAPGFAPGFGPSTIPAPTGLAFGPPAPSWVQPAPTGWTSPWTGGIPATPTLAPGLAPSAWASIAAGAMASRIPAVDVADEGKQFVCQVDLPGLSADQVELLCSEHTILVNSYREAETDVAQLVQAERATATQQRAISLPSEILTGGVKATLSNGVLTIVLPKAQPTEGPRRIKVQG